MSAARSNLIAWLDRGLIAPGDTREALKVSGVYPSMNGWALYLDRLLLGLGLVLLLSGVVTFFAANWHEIGRFGRFSLIDALLLAALAAVWRLGLESLVGRAALFAATVFVGVLLALTGQTYQTGADVYELFAVWAALVLPWVILGRFALLWIFWIGLVNLAGYLYYDSFHAFWGLVLGARGALWLSFGFNLLALLIWELAAISGSSWLQGRWAPRILATAAGMPVTFLALQAVLDAHSGDGGPLDIVAWLLWMMAGYVGYRLWRVDVFMLAGGLLSLIVVVAAMMVRSLLDIGIDVFALLIIALAVLGLSALGGRWLIRIANGQVR